MHQTNTFLAVQETWVFFFHFCDLCAIHMYIAIIFCFNFHLSISSCKIPVTSRFRESAEAYSYINLFGSDCSISN